MLQPLQVLCLVIIMRLQLWLMQRPNLTGNTVATTLNTIGIAVSGASIFNDPEGNGALKYAAVSLDWTGAHIGPGVYHYHLEPNSVYR